MKAVSLLALILLAPATTAIKNLQREKFKAIGSGLVSTYHPWNKADKFIPYGKYAGNKAVEPAPGDLVCAHRTLPFGTLLKLTRPGKPSAFCTVLDRGPYGFCRKIDDKGHKERRCKIGHTYMVARTGTRTDGYYRAILDATPSVHRMMESNGWTHASVSRAVGRDETRRVLRLNVLASR